MIQPTASFQIERRIVNAATEFVLARAEKLRLHKMRSEMLRKLFSKDEFECCMKFEDGCYQAMRDGQLNDNTQFCEYCAKILESAMSLQAGCHQECINSNIEGCVVGWPDGSCGGRAVGTWSPTLERESQSRITATTTQSAGALIRENVEGARR